MLTDPASYSSEERARLAKSLEQIVCYQPTREEEEPSFDLTRADPPLEPDDVGAYEPGCLQEDPWS
jgi:hypothetical protein